MLRRSRLRPAAAAVAAVALSTASVAAAQSPVDLKAELQRKIQALQSQLDDDVTTHGGRGGSGNRVLASRHRVGLCTWPIKGATMIGDPRAESLDAVFRHAAAAGYDGVETGADDVRLYFGYDNSIPDDVIVADVRAAAQRSGSRVLGSLYLLSDGDPGGIRGWWRNRVNASPKALRDGSRNAHRGPLANEPVDLDMQSESFYADLQEKMSRDQKLGAEYITFQVCLPPRYLNTVRRLRSCFCSRLRSC